MMLQQGSCSSCYPHRSDERGRGIKLSPSWSPEAGKVLNHAQLLHVQKVLMITVGVLTQMCQLPWYGSRMIACGYALLDMTYTLGGQEPDDEFSCIYIFLYASSHSNRQKEKETLLLRVWQRHKHNHESLLPKSNHDCDCPSHRG